MTSIVLIIGDGVALIGGSLSTNGNCLVMTVRLQLIIFCGNETASDRSLQRLQLSPKRYCLKGGDYRCSEKLFYEPEKPTRRVGSIQPEWQRITE